MKDVDVVMREELENLKAAVEKGKKAAKKGKGGKGKKGKKGGAKGKKKGKDLTEGRTIESLFAELATNAILKRCPKRYLKEYIGEYKNLDALLWKLKEPVQGFPDIKQVPELSMASIRQSVVTYCILPLGSLEVHLRAPVPKTCLLYGPAGCGKSLLSHAIATESGSAFFDLTPSNTDGKYMGKQVALMMHMVFKVAKAMAPAVIYIDDAEQAFLTDKKKTKEQGGQEIFSRIKKSLESETKQLKPEDRVLILGNSRQPFDHFTSKDMNYWTPPNGKSLWLPLPDYSSMQKVWKGLIAKKGARIDKFFDLQTLAQICYYNGYSAGSYGLLSS